MFWLGETGEEDGKSVYLQKGGGLAATNITKYLFSSEAIKVQEEEMFYHNQFI